MYLKNIIIRWNISKMKEEELIAENPSYGAKRKKWLLVIKAEGGRERWEKSFHFQYIKLLEKYCPILV